MAIPQSKEELLSVIEQTFDELWVDLQSVPEDKVQLLELEGHKKDTMMSVHEFGFVQ